MFATPIRVRSPALRARERDGAEQLVHATAQRRETAARTSRASAVAAVALSHRTRSSWSGRPGCSLRRMACRSMTVLRDPIRQSRTALLLGLVYASQRPSGDHVGASASARRIRRGRPPLARSVISALRPSGLNCTNRRRPPSGDQVRSVASAAASNLRHGSVPSARTVMYGAMPARSSRSTRRPSATSSRITAVMSTRSHIPRRPLRVSGVSWPYPTRAGRQGAARRAILGACARMKAC